MRETGTTRDQIDFLLDFLSDATPLELAEMIRFVGEMPSRGMDLTRKGMAKPKGARKGNIKQPPRAPALLVCHKKHHHCIEVNRAAMKHHHGPVKGDMGFSMVLYDEGDRRLLAVELGGGAPFNDRRGTILSSSTGIVDVLDEEIKPVVGRFSRCAIPLEGYREGRWVFSVDKALVVE